MGDQLIAGTQGYFLLCRTSWSEVRQEMDVATGIEPVRVAEIEEPHEMEGDYGVGAAFERLKKTLTPVFALMREPCLLITQPLTRTSEKKEINCLISNSISR
jgi:hypothetical protein